MQQLRALRPKPMGAPSPDVQIEALLRQYKQRESVLVLRIAELEELLARHNAPPVQWVDDSLRQACAACQVDFNWLTNRRHHCRQCGDVFCGACTTKRLLISMEPARVCDGCFSHAFKALPPPTIFGLGAFADSPAAARRAFVPPMGPVLQSPAAPPPTPAAAPCCTPEALPERPRSRKIRSRIPTPPPLPPMETPRPVRPVLSASVRKSVLGDKTNRLLATAADLQGQRDKLRAVTPKAQRAAVKKDVLDELKMSIMRRRRSIEGSPDKLVVPVLKFEVDPNNALNNTSFGW